MADDPTSVDCPTTAADVTATGEATTRLGGDRDPDEGPNTRLYTQEGNQYHGIFSITGGTVNQGNFMTINDYDSYNRKVLEWLSPLTFEDKQTDVYGGCQPEYWTWLFDVVKFKDWSRGGKGDFLFCPGMAGTGKSAFAAVVTEHMRSIKKNASSEIGVACLYFDYYESREMQTPNNMVSSLTRQLVKQSSHLHELIRVVYEDVSEGRATRTFKHNIDMLKAVVSQFSSTYIIIDALDECSEVDTPHNDKETKRFLSALKDEIRLCTTVLVTCRTNDYLKGKFDEMPILNIRARNEDLVNYIKMRTSKGTDLGDRVHHKEHPDLESRIVQKIVDTSDGIFLFAKLQLDNLADQTNAADTCEALESTPTTLQELYAKAIMRVKTQVKPDRSDLAMKVLAWILHAKRPLLAIELRHALSVRPEDTALRFSRFPPRDTLTNVCLGLVSIDLTSGIIRLVHYTLQEYLLGTGKELFPDAEVHITGSCLDYLLLQPETRLPSSSHSPGTVLTDDEESPGNRSLVTTLRSDMEHFAVEHYQHYRFLGYATRYWGIHARRNAERQLKGQILQYLKMERGERTLQFSNGDRSLRHRFLSSSPYWVEFRGPFCFCEPSKHIEATHYLDSLGSLHRAAAWGFTHLVEEILNDGADVSNRDDHDWTALFWAALHGYEDVLNLLIKKGTNPDAKCKTSTSDTPLYWAAKYGHEAVLDILLENGADFRHVINSYRDSYRDTAMGAAVTQGHTAIVKRLLNAGMKVDDDLQGDAGKYALIEAAGTGKEDMVDLLIKYGADANMEDSSGFYSNPLIAAAVQRHRKIVEKLVSKGANINTNQKVGSGIRNPLLAAIARYKFVTNNETFEMVKLLLDLGANPNITHPTGETPLCEAVTWGDADVVNLLLKQNADVNQKNENDSTPLHLAVCLSRQEKVLMLLKHGADPNITSEGSTPLTVALRTGHAQILEHLLQFGADQGEEMTARMEESRKRSLDAESDEQCRSGRADRKRRDGDTDG